ncbi:bis(5'-nucleosyl)-tetraphosphatase (symmetrical) YqeK [Eubacterium oxidoreducens]|uniref:bis(5'-nucleosyl)-tetraphosphatase (symmetrical) n=1 Tax=Eubacterium oxidoreducens TaxID=1732 RepID=A0A1G6ALV7_EUBOX|nr:bis(5'-nucleosyl)-tetraphosphatase (symmetrical) YqeK [Eubacterium oxidoreducens]SDB09365.1 putative HD superfamily hydrolase of NAD metabolism [Eubacterium oxidoreducens]
MTSKYDSIKKQLQNTLNEHRFTHTLGVAYTASALAMRYQANVEKAFLAGLLHDCAKNIPSDKMLQICKENEIRISSAEQSNPQLLHAKLGAYIAKEEYAVHDEEVLNSIRLHTTGAPKMTVLDKIIYIADYIEPNRKELPHMAEIRHHAFEDLDMAMEEITTDVLNYLISNGNVIDEMTLNTQRYYQQLNKEKRN